MRIVILRGTSQTPVCCRTQFETDGVHRAQAVACNAHPFGRMLLQPRALHLVEDDARVEAQVMCANAATLFDGPGNVAEEVPQRISDRHAVLSCVLVGDAVLLRGLSSYSGPSAGSTPGRPRAAARRAPARSSTPGQPSGDHRTEGRRTETGTS